MAQMSDETKKSQFPYHLQADSTADIWFEELPDEDKKDWSSIETAFRLRWPRKKAVKKTSEEYEDEIMTLKLRMEDLGKKEKVAGRDVYSHIVWADKMGAIVKGAKLEKTTTYIGGVRKTLPNLLREKLGAGHENWTVFLDAIRDINIDYIRDGVDIWKKEEAKQDAIKQRLQELEKNAIRPTASTIHRQMSALTINTAPPISRSASLQGTGRRSNNSTFPAQPRPPPTQADRNALRVHLQKYPQQPDTETGRQAHRAQQADWVRTYGVGTRVTESTPYPLRPGTAPINSGECFTCGFTGHYGQRDVDASITCGGRKPLIENEQRWRSICARILREPKPTVAPAPSNGTAAVNLVAIDDYGTMVEVEDQGNGEGLST